jgi:NAD(P)-dependent dehydrogenase (short-subunit alcohol dehydrogenase family)
MPIGIPYTATKHAVVGLSLGLRAEAAGRGVRVSVVCPSFVDTPLLHTVNPDLPETALSGNATGDIAKASPRLYTAEKLARDIMRGVAKNQALIVAPAHGRLAWRGVRLNPGAAVRVAQIAVDRIRSGK